MIKQLAFVFCIAQLVSSSPYQYNTYTTASSTPAYILKQNLNAEIPQKYSVGYKVQDTSSSPSSNKVKKEYSNSDYQNFYIQDQSKKLQSYSPEFTSFDDTYSTTSSSVTPYPYPVPAKLNPVLPNLYTHTVPKAYQVPPTGSSKVFHHSETKPHHLVHDAVGHYITDVAGHKLKHVGEALESGALTEPILHKLSFAKAALLQLLAIIGPLSAIKTIHVVARASDPHHPPPAPAPAENVESIPPFSVAPEVPIEQVEHFEPHHHPTNLVEMILHFVAQLSKFNTHAKLHLIPNLLKVVSYASSSSAHTSGHHPH